MSLCDRLRGIVPGQVVQHARERELRERTAFQSVGLGQPGSCFSERKSHKGIERSPHSYIVSVTAEPEEAVGSPVCSRRRCAVAFSAFE
jgi:hypothetical protein